MEGNHNKEMCTHCPIEKEPNGSCFDGLWLLDELGNMIFSGVWKCKYYTKDTDTCDCPKMTILE